MRAIKRNVGVDGCKGGWIAASRDDPAKPPALKIFTTIAELISHFDDATFIAIDMPIGLPDHIIGSGRGPEQAIRSKLGARKSSVFSIPSRQAVYCDDYKQACAIAFETSEPPKKFSKQGFYLFPKIREIDMLLQDKVALRAKLFECHPELAFWQINTQTPLMTAKKLASTQPHGCNQERYNLLNQHNAVPDILKIKGAAKDDILDACACLLIAERRAMGQAIRYPEQIITDSCGIQIAIWA